MLQQSQINRYENKYLISEATAREIADFIRPICDLDAFADPVTKSYVIHSVYFDTPALDFYNAQMKKPLVRFKPRARTYASNPACPYVWLELKCKISNKSHKTRLRIDAKDWPDFMERAPHLVDQSVFKNDGFMHVVTRYGAIPTTHVRYRREPYFSTIDNYVRLTFDRELAMLPATSPHLLAGDDKAFMRDAIPMDDEVSYGEEGMVLLEIKCEESMPYWVGDLVRRFRLEMKGISKYTLSVDAMRLPHIRKAGNPSSNVAAACVGLIEGLRRPAGKPSPSRSGPVVAISR